MRTQFLTLSLAACLLAACSDDEPSSPNSGGTIQLTDAQASVIKARVVQLAPVHPDLAWLADTIRLVVQGGVEVNKVNITTNADNEPFYAVSLQRTIRTSFSNAAAFDVILFNDPSNPTDFMIASGWTNPNMNADPPTSMSGQFGSPTSSSIVNAHFFHVDGSTVTAWRAISGTATFALAGSSGSCPAVPNWATGTCQQAELNATFNVTEARSDNQSISSIRAGALAATDVGGIIIRMTIQ